MAEPAAGAGADVGGRHWWGLLSPAEPVVLPAPRGLTQWPGKGEDYLVCWLPLEGVQHPVASPQSAAKGACGPRRDQTGQYLQPQQLPQPPAAGLLPAPPLCIQLE